MENKKRVAINMVAQIGAFIIGLGISFVLTPYITKYVGKEIYGFVGLGNTFTSYITILVVALNGMLNRFVTIKLKQGETALANQYYSSVAIGNIALSVILLIPTSLMVLLLERIINIPSYAAADVKLLWLFIFMGFFINVSAAPLGTATFATNRLDLVAIRNLGNNIIRAVLLVLLYNVFSAKIWYVGLAVLLCSIYVLITNYYYKNKLVPELKIKFKYFKWQSVKELVSIGVWNSVNQLTHTLINGLDLLITNLLIDPLSMSLMSFSKTIPVQIYGLIGIVSQTFTPQMTLTYAEGDMEKFIKETKYALKICGFICSVPILGFVAFGQSFFTLWLETLSVEEVNKVQILSILTLLPTIFSIYVYPLYSVNTITCKVKIPVLVSLVIGIVNLIAVFILLKGTTLGVFAVKIVSSVLLVFRVTLFTPIYASHVLKIKWYTFYPPIVRGVMTSAVILSLYYGIRNRFIMSSWTHLIMIAIPAGLMGYMINYMILLKKNEREKINQLILRKLGRG